MRESLRRLHHMCLQFKLRFRKGNTPYYFEKLRLRRNEAPRGRRVGQSTCSCRRLFCAQQAPRRRTQAQDLSPSMTCRRAPSWQISSRRTRTKIAPLFCKRKTGKVDSCSQLSQTSPFSMLTAFKRCRTFIDGRDIPSSLSSYQDQIALKMVLPEKLSCIAIDTNGDYCAGGTALGRIFLWEAGSNSLLVISAELQLSIDRLRYLVQRLGRSLPKNIGIALHSRRRWSRFSCG